MKKQLFSSTLLLLCFLNPFLIIQGATPQAAAPLDIITNMIEGNKRFYTGHLSHIDQSQQRVHAVAKDQHPYAVVITCSDSRVVPEILFDYGLGDIFNIRVAGNVLDESVLGSVEYSVAHLNVPVVLILGHKRCGAVTATVHHDNPHNHINYIIRQIAPAVKSAENEPGDIIDNAVRNNVANMITKLKEQSDIVISAIEKGKLSVIGGYYDLDSGRVEFTNF